MKKGEPILLDEFNLCTENILINLLPILKANINDKIYWVSTLTYEKKYFINFRK